MFIVESAVNFMQTLANNWSMNRYVQLYDSHLSCFFHNYRERFLVLMFEEKFKDALKQLGEWVGQGKLKV